MSKNIAVIDNNGKVLAINIYQDNYELKSNEIIVTNSAFVDGDYFEGYFYAPQPYLSWTRDKGNWVPPVLQPTDGNEYQWDEEQQKWIEV
jgi:hypothetical protein